MNDNGVCRAAPGFAWVCYKEMWRGDFLDYITLVPAGHIKNHLLFLNDTNMVKFAFVIAFYNRLFNNSSSEKTKSELGKFFFIFSQFSNVPGDI